MNYEEEIRNSAGKAAELADNMHPFKKAILIMSAEYQSGLISVWYRVDCVIAKVKTIIERDR
ncbi:hypothetical protein M3573_19220 [Bacillus safensis]|uniref:hypothetical protein n=1 Tax=Bacillus safensis TaxID=561879 RepID=UPI00203FBB87|nr:hypothetical protein [Bacillus safensis]MCM3140411.1 hypothetical protein [Bacillus safensis]